MRILPQIAAVASVAGSLALISGCRGQASSSADGGAAPPASPEVSKASQELSGRLSDLINESNARYRALTYEYDEDLLKVLDRFEAYDSGKPEGPAPRAMPKLDEQEELAHLRETVRRWQAKTKKNLRAEVDTLKAEVAARAPGGPAFHPEFHKHFSAVFDEFIPIEVAEIRERRNRYLHEKAAPVLDEYRQKSPDAVRAHEATLNAPPYDLPPAAPAEGKS